MKRNSTTFPFFLKEEMKKIEKQYDSKIEMLKHYQYATYKYMTNMKTGRGLLLFMETGYGKTLTAIAIAQYFIKNTNRKIIILLAKGLVDNFKNNIIKYMDFMNPKITSEEINNHIETKYKFISLNSSKMFSNIIQENKNKKIIENQLKILVNSGKINNLENNLLIVDEAHNLFNSITNGSMNATKLYDQIMKTENIKLLFLTGTPMINYPFEIVPCMNMLSGKIRIPKTKIQSTLLSEDEGDFNELFVNMQKNTLKNTNILSNRILGLVSYYGKKFNKKINKEIGTSMFPKQLELKIIKCPMSDYQYSIYLEARKIELNENKSFGKKMDLFKKQKFREKSKTKSNSYRIRSRQLSNFSLPNYTLKRSTKTKFYIKNLEKLDIEDYVNNLNKYSPKMAILLKALDNTPNTELIVIYSTFVTIEGIGLISKVLKNKGYIEYIPKKSIQKNIEENYGKIEDSYINNKKKRFAIISGKVKMEDREIIIQKFSNEKNKNGAIINILIFSNTGVEGLDLKCVRHVHIFEPFWNYARIVQVIARAVRYKSHILLSKENRTVQPYIYLASHPKHFNLKKMLANKEHHFKRGHFIEERTTDLDILFAAKKHFKLIQEMEYLLVKSSIDCHIHSNNTIVKCKICNPTGRSLFSESLSKREILYDPCKKIIEEEIEAKEIIINDKTFFYVLDEKSSVPDIYETNKFSENYIKIKNTNPFYLKIIKKINKIEKIDLILGGSNINYIMGKDFLIKKWLKRL